MCAKVTTAITNSTSQVLTMKLGVAGRYGTLIPLVPLKMDAVYTLKVDIYETYQEYCCVAATGGSYSDKIFVKSDDCCDFQRITIKEENSDGCCDFEPITITEGKLEAGKIPRVSAANSRRSCFDWRKLSWRFWM